MIKFEIIYTSHRTGKVYYQHTSEKSLQEALQELLFFGLYRSVLDNIEFPNKMQISGSYHFQGNAEEMKIIYQATLLHHLFYYPQTMWEEDGYGFDVYRELSEKTDWDPEMITLEMVAYYNANGYRRKTNGQGSIFCYVQAKFIYMLMAGITDKNELFAGIELEKDDLIAVVDIWCEDKKQSFCKLLQELCAAA